MKATANPQQLKAALHRVAAAPSFKVGGAVNLIADEFGGLTIKRTTGLATMKVECEAEVEEGGECAVALDKLNDLAGRWSGDTCEITRDASKLNFKVGTSKASLVIWPEKDLEPDLEPIQASTITFDSERFLDFIEVGLRAAYTGGERANIRGVNIRTAHGRITVAGMDGRRIHACFGEETFEGIMPAEDGSHDPGVLLPKEIVNAVARMIGDDHCAVRLKVSERGGQIEAAGRTFRFLTPQDVAPNIDPFLVPTDRSAECVTDRKGLIKIVKSALPLSYGDSRRIAVSWTASEITVEADDQSGNIYTDSQPAKADKPHQLCVNGDYLMDFLESLKGDAIRLCHAPGYNALTCTEEDRYLILMLIRAQ